jgi:hypothetical protein
MVSVVAFAICHSPFSCYPPGQLARRDIHEHKEDPSDEKWKMENGN